MTKIRDLNYANYARDNTSFESANIRITAPATPQEIYDQQVKNQSFDLSKAVLNYIPTAAYASAKRLGERLENADMPNLFQLLQGTVTKGIPAFAGANASNPTASFAVSFMVPANMEKLKIGQLLQVPMLVHKIGACAGSLVEIGHLRRKYNESTYQDVIARFNPNDMIDEVNQVIRTVGENNSTCITLLNKVSGDLTTLLAGGKITVTKMTEAEEFDRTNGFGAFLFVIFNNGANNTDIRRLATAWSDEGICCSDNPDADAKLINDAYGGYTSNQTAYGIATTYPKSEEEFFFNASSVINPSNIMMAVCLTAALYESAPHILEAYSAVKSALPSAAEAVNSATQSASSLARAFGSMAQYGYKMAINMGKGAYQTAKEVCQVLEKDDYIKNKLAEMKARDAAKERYASAIGKLDKVEAKDPF